MELQRKKQLLIKIESAYNSWLKCVDQNSKVDDIEQVVEMISNKLAFGTIIISGRNEPCSYIGTYRQCKNLKDTYGGQIGCISYVWYWIGVTQSDNIRKLLNNKQKNLIITVPVDDIEEAILNVGEIASLDIRYGNVKNGRSSYIGNYKVCILLRQKFSGKIGKIHNHWHWIGYASFDSIENVYKSYQGKAKRFKRKRIELTF